MSKRVKRGDCVLLVADVQEKLIGTIAERAELVENIRVLVTTAETLDIPILMTEQEKLGGTIVELDRASIHFPKFRKLSFSCCEDRRFLGKLGELGQRTVIVCRVEAHICVLQTALDLLERGYCVVVPKDATSSYAAVDRETAIERMSAAEATITTTEALIYELTERAGTEEFGKILEIVKKRRKAVAEMGSSDTATCG